MSPAKYKPGDSVMFADSTEVLDRVRRGGPTDCLASGIVNGQPRNFADEGDEPLWYVPVWTEREGREPTTIFVNAANIISGKKKERGTPR